MIFRIEWSSKEQRLFCGAINWFRWFLTTVLVGSDGCSCPVWWEKGQCDRFPLQLYVHSKLKRHSRSLFISFLAYYCKTKQHPPAASVITSQLFCYNHFSFLSQMETTLSPFSFNSFILGAELAEMKTCLSNRFLTWKYKREETFHRIFSENRFNVFELYYATLY